MTFPNDDQYQEVKIKAVAGTKETGWGIEREDGWHFHIDGDSPIEPKAGMTVRMYGKGIGFAFRGVYLDGQEVFYRTEAEEKEHQEIASYGADAADWLSRWDADMGVWSIEMGGIGPGYEQAIQITVAEVVRHLLEKKYDTEGWENETDWQRDREDIYKHSFENERIKSLGLSGAQWGAALGLAARIYRDGPRVVLTHPSVQDRKIQVSRTFPGMAA